MLGLMVTQGCAVYTQYFFLTWLPNYLQTERGMSLLKSGALMSLPVFDGGRREAGVQTANAQWDIAAASYREQVLGAFRDVEDQLASLRLLADQAGAQKVAVDAAWAISAGSDATRADALSGADVPEEVGRQRWAIDQILRATLTDKEVCRAFENVAYMVAHPSTLADPALLERAVTANRGGGPA